MRDRERERGRRGIEKIPDDFFLGLLCLISRHDAALITVFLQLRKADSMQFAAGSSDSEEQDRGLDCMWVCLRTGIHVITVD